MSSLTPASEAETARGKIFGDVAAWAGNVSTSVAIVFVNKLLMQTFGCHFSTTLTALHFVACTVAVWFAQRAGKVEQTTMPFKDLMLFTAVADVSVLTLNLSLMLNTVSFYQIAKLLVIPFVCFIESSFLGQTFTRQVVASIVMVVAGVAIVTVQELQLDVSFGGMVIAAVSVVSSGLQQIFVRTMQQKHKLSAHELLSNTAPVQAWSLLLVGPFIDKLASNEWVYSYSFTRGAAVTMAASCALAVLVNVSQFMCLGRFSAVSFQVLGHSKTILVLLGGWAFLGDTITAKKFAGMALAVCGMIWYGTASAAAAKPAMKVKTSMPSDEEAEKEELIAALPPGSKLYSTASGPPMFAGAGVQPGSFAKSPV